jgi:hypothetical protein
MSDVGLDTALEATVTPVPVTATVVPAVMKFVPVIVTVVEMPCAAVAGEMLAMVGGGGFTVNVDAALVPPLVVTVTLRAPSAASAAIASFAVIDVVLCIATSLTVTPVPLTATVAPETKFVPVNVTVVDEPVTPAVALRLVSVGGAGMTVNVCVALVPLLVVTVIVRGPGVAFGAITSVAVAEVELTSVALCTAMSVAPLIATVIPDTKFVPVSETTTVVPATPLVGAMLASVGGGVGVGVGVVGVDGVSDVSPEQANTTRAAAASRRRGSVLRDMGDPLYLETTIPRGDVPAATVLTSVRAPVDWLMLKIEMLPAWLAV